MAKAVALIDEGLASLPAVAKPVEEMTHAELLNATAREGLLAVHAIITKERVMYNADGSIGRDVSVREERLVGDMSLGIVKVMLAAQEAAMRGRQGDQLGRILEELQKISVDDDPSL